MKLNRFDSFKSISIITITLIVINMLISIMIYVSIIIPRINILVMFRNLYLRYQCLILKQVCNDQKKDD